MIFSLFTYLSNFRTKIIIYQIFHKYKSKLYLERRILY